MFFPWRPSFHLGACSLFMFSDLPEILRSTPRDSASYGSSLLISDGSTELILWFQFLLLILLLILMGVKGNAKLFYCGSMLGYLILLVYCWYWCGFYCWLLWFKPAWDLPTVLDMHRSSWNTAVYLEELGIFWCGKNCSGWWCNNHLEKYESQWEGWHPICEVENKSDFWNRQPVLVTCPFHHWIARLFLVGWPTPRKNDGVKVSWDDDFSQLNGTSQSIHVPTTNQIMSLGFHL